MDKNNIINNNNNNCNNTDNNDSNNNNINLLYVEALNMVTDFILISSFSLLPSPLLHEIDLLHPYYTQIANNNLEVKVMTLNNFTFMNDSLKKFLGYSNTNNNINNNTNNKESEKMIEGGEVVIVADSDNDKLQCSVKLYNSKNEIIRLYGTCNIKEGTCILKMQELELDEHLYLYKYFNTLGVFMTVVELGPDDGTYEWRHVMPNKWSFGFYKLSYDKLTKYCASERNSIRERKHFHDACMASKLHGIQVPIVPDITDTYIPLLGSYIAYIGVHPVTKRDIFACAVFDPKTVKMATERVAELGDFFEFAPMMMGAAKVTKGKIESLYCNQAAADFCKLTKREMMGDLSKIRFYAGELEGVFTDNYKKSRENRDHPVQFSVSVPGPTGRQHFFTATISTIAFNRDLDESKHVFIMLDLTAQKEAELALEAHRNSLEETVRMRTLELKEKEQRFRSLVSNAPNIILSVDTNGVVEYANRNITKEEKEGETLVGKFLHTLVVDGPSLMTRIRLLFETHLSFNMEVKLLESDIWLTINAGPMSATTAIIVATDITAIKRMSEELHHALATKSRFLANMSHEVRTPLSGIIGMTRILQEESSHGGGHNRLTLDQAECVSTIQHCGETLLSVINDVLDYTKLEATGMTLDHAELSLRQCMEESLYTVLPTAQKKKLELIIDIDPYIPDKILGDMLRLRQVVVNLLNNSVKFTDVGYVMISLTGKEISGSDEWQYCCTIKDTGCGVPQESQSKLFQMFSQVDISTTRKYGGTGIGLALSRRFVEMMNGDITMYSSGVPGEGCTFTFTITATVAPFASVISPASVLSSSPRWLITSTNVFILEKLAISAEILKKRLSAKGFYSIHTMPSSNDAETTFSSISSFLSSLRFNENKNVLIFCDADKLTPGKNYPLLSNPNVAIVLMGYIQPSLHFNPSSSSSDSIPLLSPSSPTLSSPSSPSSPSSLSPSPSSSLSPFSFSYEFLRKPIKQASFIRCLREIWSRFFEPKISAALSSSRIPSLLHSPSALSPPPSPFPSSSSSSSSTPPSSPRNNAPVTPPFVVPEIPLKILVVEDNEMNQKVVRRIFQHMKYPNVPIANHGKEALEIIEKNGLPDMILMDIQMPILDGVQTTKMIRSKYLNAHWPYILAVTADVFPEDRKKCLEAGMNDFLTKPIRIEQVQAAVQKCIKLKETQNDNG